MIPVQKITDIVFPTNVFKCNNYIFFVKFKILMCLSLFIKSYL